MRHIAAFVFLLVVPMAALSDPAAVAQAPQTKSPEDTAFEEIKTFFDAVGEKGVYWPKDKPRQTEDLPLAKVLEKFRTEGRIRFGSLKTKQGTTAAGAEYDTETGIITINLDAVRDLLTASALLSEPKARPENKALWWALRAGVAQSIVHEMRHAWQHPRLPFPPAEEGNEAAAYRLALDRTEAWIRHFERELQQSPSLDNCVSVRGLCAEWLTYKDLIVDLLRPREGWTLEGHMGADGRPSAAVLAGMDLAAKVKQIEAIRDQAEDLQRVLEVLRTAPASVASAFTGSGKPTLEELLERIPADIGTDQELRKWIEQQIQAARKNGFGPKGDDAERIFAEQAYRGMLERWRSRRQRLRKELEAAIEQLLKRPFRATGKLSPPKLGPPENQVTLTVSIEDTLRPAIDSALRLAGKLSGQLPNVEVSDTWTNPEGGVRTTDGLVEKSRTFPLTKTGPAVVTIRRVIRVSGLGAGATSRESPVVERLVRCEVAAAGGPGQIAGTWSGTLSIATARIESDGREQGCDLTDKLKGAGQELKIELDGNGRASFIPTPPRDVNLGVAAVAMEYTYGNGQFTAKGQTPGGILSLRGSVVPDGKRWKLSGTWSVGGGKLKANGSYSVTNSTAK